jgi:hypothetical protein
LQHIASGAINDSNERCDAPKCHTETRAALQEEIVTWIRHGDADDEPRQILWLTGPAGTGKTAIAGSVADKCQREGWLAASFFFSAFAGSPTRRSKMRLITSLAYQLIQHDAIHGLKDLVLAAIDHDPLIFDKRLDHQLRVMILEPLRKLSKQKPQSIEQWPLAIIIDGLDECTGQTAPNATQKEARRSKEESHKEILSVLMQAANDPAFPFHIIIASRPEPVIRDFFSAFPDIAHEIFLDEKYDPDSDIALFLSSKFVDIRRRYNLPTEWVPATTFSTIATIADVIEFLVRESSGQFIYAVTAVRYIEDGTHPPQEQLKRVLEWRRQDESGPFAPLDALYRRIPETSPDPLLAAKWICSIDPIRQNTVYGYHMDQYVKALLETSLGEMEYLLRSLPSLLGVHDDKGALNFRLYHKTFVDFLEDQSRSADLHISADVLRQYLCERHYRVLKSTWIGIGTAVRATH